MRKQIVAAVFGCMGLISVVACSGVSGLDGKPGDPGAPGSNGQQGAAGEQGQQGQIGDMICGDTLIKAADWHSACNTVQATDPSGVVGGVCVAGQEQCRLTDQDGQLIPQVMCWDTTGNTAAVLPVADPKFPNNPVAAKSTNRCDMDTTCSGVADNTTGVGTQVALVRTALTYLSPVQSSQNLNGGAQTWLPGLCENAVEHCLGDTTTAMRLSTDEDAGTATVRVSCDGYGQPETKTVCVGSEGVVMADFTADPKEGLMGTDCVDANGSVRLYDCVVDAVSGVASVQCAGAIQ